MPVTQLPIEALRDQLRPALEHGKPLILQAPTGSGKSTQIPQMLIDEGVVPQGRVIVLQPRRLAARMLASRVASERNGRPGSEVGYHIRFDRTFCEDTRILFITEGILLRMLLSNPLLDGISAVVFDEFHERHLDADLGLALVNHLRKHHRPDLRMLVMSATLQTVALANYLPDASTLKADGRTFPVEIEQHGPARGVPEDLVHEQATHHFRRLFKACPEGDFLIFMPGAWEISRTVESIQATPEGRQCTVLPLHGELPPAQQDAAVKRYPKRKVVVATNVAETSLTIDGIRFVIDSGLARFAAFDPHRGINTLLIGKISHASADQRAGRAGRTAPGICVRLWTQKDHEHRQVATTPEILRVDLAETLLSLKLHEASPTAPRLDDFPWFDPPEPEQLQRAFEHLRDLGALDANDGITETGRRMAAFPLAPRYARMLLEAGKRNCVNAVCHVVAISQGRDLLLPLRDKRRAEEREDVLGEAESDFFHRLTAFGMARKKGFDVGFCRQWGIHAQAARQADHASRQLLGIAENLGLDTEQRPIDESSVRQCLLAGFSDQLAVRDDRGTLNCSIVHGRRGELRRDSAVRHASLFVASEIDEIQSRGSVTTLLSLATAVEEEWLEEQFPDDWFEDFEDSWDLAQNKVVRRYVIRFRDLVIEARERGEPDPARAAEIIAERVRSGKIRLNVWNAKAEAFVERINFAAANCPELEIQPIDDEGRELIAQQLCLGACSARDLDKADVWPILNEWLDATQRAALDQLAPETFQLPTRKHPTPLRYEDGRVILSSRLQDFYDVDASRLMVANGRVPITCELLAPNGRPAQVTNDLANFWSTSYIAVKKDLKGRYPKHEWR